MDVFRVRSDGVEEPLAAGLSPGEIEQLRDWFCYTKPLGSSMKIVTRSKAISGACFSVLIAGHEPGPAMDCMAELELTR